MAKGTRNRPSKPENADVEISAGAKTDELRFEKAPQTKARFWETRGRKDTGVEAASGSNRDNLPGKVELGVTYRDASIRWRAAGKLAVDDRLREVFEGGEAQRRGAGRSGARTTAEKRDDR